MSRKVAIVGAGPAGMMAAYFAAEGGAEVYLYDKNPVIGKKLIYVPWDGCEITQTGDTEDFMENYARGAEFLQYTLDKFGYKNIIKFFKQLNVELHTDENGVVSPLNGESSKIQEVFEEKLKELGVEFCMSSKVQEVLAEGRKITGIKVHNLEREFDKVVIATGGAARPKLGATGDGYRFAEGLRHSIIEPKPAMTEIETEERLGKLLGGLTLSPVIISIYNNRSKLFERKGTVTFTDHGINGDTVLFLSGVVARLIDKGRVEISLDLYPKASREKLERELIEESSMTSHYTVGEILKRYIPSQLLPVLSRFFRIQESKPMSHITNLERKSLIIFVKDFRLTVKRVKPFFSALYTSGGVDTEEVNPKSMESKMMKGLYLCGEVLDVDGGPGGYNIHSALATGYIAGKSVARGVKAAKAAEKKTTKAVKIKEEKPAAVKKTAKKKAVKKVKKAVKKTAKKTKAVKKKKAKKAERGSSRRVA
ncbi:MAG: aminoacetone oxidase family FAD-binding enzyme [candidate division Zixibacteria bacterium]|nr:aminoacetone oxidase family FAD-binding enzyme [candidate division Zixibacteria bacterium]